MAVYSGLAGNDAEEKGHMGDKGLQPRGGSGILTPKTTRWGTGQPGTLWGRLHEARSASGSSEAPPSHILANCYVLLGPADTRGQPAVAEAPGLRCGATWALGWATGACQWRRLYSCSQGLIVTLASRGALGRGSPGARVQAPSALLLPPPHPFRTCGELSPPCGASSLRLSPAVLSKVASSLWLNLWMGAQQLPFPATCLLPAPLSPAEPKTLAWGGGSQALA